ncbi:MAG: hypothetical protein H6715_06550 [Myxococcales bacterium]|nr:hypothetical protein [Myxococcales bacterium]MCB9708563.1 hypothetical protein [Myxococcales bacterium]
MQARSSSHLESTATIGSSQDSDPRALRILAKSTYRELRSGGLSRSELVSFASELLDLVTDDIDN